MDGPILILEKNIAFEKLKLPKKINLHTMQQSTDTLIIFLGRTRRIFIIIGLKLAKYKGYNV